MNGGLLNVTDYCTAICSFFSLNLTHAWSAQRKIGNGILNCHTTGLKRERDVHKHRPSYRMLTLQADVGTTCSQKCENGPWPRSWQRPAISTHRTSWSVMTALKFGNLRWRRWRLSTNSRAKNAVLSFREEIKNVITLSSGLSDRSGFDSIFNREVA